MQFGHGVAQTYVPTMMTTNMTAPNMAATNAAAPVVVEQYAANLQPFQDYDMYQVVDPRTGGVETKAVPVPAGASPVTLAQYAAGGGSVLTPGAALPVLQQPQHAIALPKLKKIYPVVWEKLLIFLGGFFNFGLAMWLLAVYVGSDHQVCAENLRAVFLVGWIFHTVMVLFSFLALYEQLRCLLIMLGAVSVLCQIALTISMTVLFARVDEVNCYKPLWDSAMAYFILQFVLLVLFLLAACFWVWNRWEQANAEDARERRNRNVQYQQMASPVATFSPQAVQV